MRIALILLSILAMIFIGSVTWSLIWEDGALMKSKNISQDVDSIALETWKNQIKTDEKIEKLSAMVAELQKSNSTNPTITPPSTNSGNTIKISGKLLELLMPTMTLTLWENRWIYGLYVFDQSIAYSTYKDDKYGLTVIPMNTSYDILLQNLKAISGKPYTINEVKTFPMRSFYLNPDKTDTLVRLIVESEKQVICLEIPKSNFTLLKNLLTQNQNTTNPIKKK